MKHRKFTIISILGLAALTVTAGAANVSAVVQAESAVTSKAIEYSAQFDSRPGNTIDIDSVRMAPSAAEAEEVSDWSKVAGEAADRVQEALEQSSDRAIFSTIVIDERTRALVTYFTASPSTETIASARKASADIPVKVSDASRVTATQFVNMVERMYGALDPKREKIGLISPNESFTSVTLSVWPSADQNETARAVKRALHPINVIIDHGPRPVGPVDYASRWDDKSLFKGGAGLVSGTNQFCTSGFAARRNSDDAKVMITAEHCGLGALWGTAIGGNAYGEGWYRSSATDSQYMAAPAGLGYGSLIYSGGVNATATKVRKNSAYDAKVGDVIYAGGAASGGSSQKVIATDQYGIYGEGPGFLTDAVSGLRSVGEGDSGGPVFRLHTDGEYTPLGMVKGNGWAVNSLPRKMATQGSCQKGVESFSPGVARICSVRSFHINATAIEKALKVDIYKP